MIGTLLILIGVLIRFICVRQMGRFNLVIRDVENIKTDGIYKYIRHPSYLGSMIALVGISMISLHFAFFYLVFMFFLARVVQEENILLNHPEYREYHKKAGMFLPRMKKQSSAISTNLQEV